MCLGQTVYGGEEAAWVPASHTMAEGPVPPHPLRLPSLWPALMGCGPLGSDLFLSLSSFSQPFK